MLAFIADVEHASTVCAENMTGPALELDGASNIRIVRTYILSERMSCRHLLILKEGSKWFASDNAFIG